MTVIEAPTRFYCVQLGTKEGGWAPVMRVHADVVCEGSAEDEHLVFKRNGGSIVGKMRRDVVHAWWIEEA